jgi:hypothetical protein
MSAQRPASPELDADDAVAVSFLRARVPEGAPEPEPVPEVPVEPVPGAATEPEAPSFRVSRFRPTPRPRSWAARRRACEW